MLRGEQAACPSAPISPRTSSEPPRSPHGTIDTPTDETTLRLVEEAVASRAPASVSHPIRDELLPRLGMARTLGEAEQVIHDAGRALPWLGDALVSGPESEQALRDALARVVSRMLAIQDGLERALGAVVGAVAARKAIVAHETLRRFLAVCVQVPRGEAREHREIPSAARPSIEYMRRVAARLALLVVALEHLVGRGSALVAPLADKAFETSQTFRRAMQDLGVDLTPWTDAPPATRVKRIMEAANGFWSSLDDDQRRAVGEAWDERVELPSRWPPPPSWTRPSSRIWRGTSRRSPPPSAPGSTPETAS
jgi:hypothetical protein